MILRDLVAATRPYVRLISNFQIYVLAGLISTSLSELLLLTIPLFIRGFIDYIDVLSARELLKFPLMMLGVAALAYLFDMISVSVRFLLGQEVDVQLKEIYINYSFTDDEQTHAFALRSGLAQMANFTVNMSLIKYLHLIRIALILVFIFFENTLVGLATGISLLLALSAGLFLTRILGRASRAKEEYINRFLHKRRDDQRLKGRDFADSVDDMEAKMFLGESGLFFLAYVLFHLLPVGVLLVALYGTELTTGALASLILYLSLLRPPFQEMLSFIKDNIRYFSDSEIFRGELERSLLVAGLLNQADRGLVWCTRLADLSPSGVPLSTIDFTDGGSDCLPPGCREVHDDQGALFDGEGRLHEDKARRLHSLARLAARKSILLHATDSSTWQFAHFKVDDDGVLEPLLNDDSPASWVADIVANGRAVLCHTQAAHLQVLGANPARELK